MEIKLFFLVSFLLIIFLYQPHYEGYTGYNYLMDQFTKIFPDNNRNAGGAQFYKHIYDIRKEITTKDYINHNTYFCSVSGSPIDPKRTDAFDYVKVNHINGSTYIGKLYRCCWPCSCDIIKYTKLDDFTIQLKDKSYTHKVLTIGDPCKDKSKIPQDVSSFQCKQSKTHNGVHTKNKRLIIGILHEPELYNSQKHDSLIQPTMKQCKKRMNTKPSELTGGMGDIFVSMAIINP